jgi:hypothetical protein
MGYARFRVRIDQSINQSINRCSPAAPLHHCFPKTTEPFFPPLFGLLISSIPNYSYDYALCAPWETSRNVFSLWGPERKNIFSSMPRSAHLLSRTRSAIIMLMAACGIWMTAVAAAKSAGPPPPLDGRADPADPREYLASPISKNRYALCFAKCLADVSSVQLPTSFSIILRCLVSFLDMLFLLRLFVDGFYLMIAISLVERR